jgi:hypothetical protein
MAFRVRLVEDGRAIDGMIEWLLGRRFGGG